MIVGHIGGSSSGGYEIQKSLRFRASASAYLSRTYASAGSTTTWTQSVWVKRGALSSGLHDIFRTHYSATYHIGLYFNANDALNFVQWTGSAAINMSTTQVFRDSSAWYHIVLAVDSTQATASNRVKLYVNGVQITSFNTATYPTQNSDTYMCSSTGWTHVIGKFYDFATTNYFDGYLSEINFIDGQALNPSYFGQVSAETGSWIPKKYTGTYGTNGFYLPFNDGSTLGNLTADRSGNGNNWTANNISLTAGATYDWFTDTPTNNYATLNPLTTVGGAFADGNLRYNNSGGWRSSSSTISVSSGKWSAEVTLTSAPYSPKGSGSMWSVLGLRAATVFADNGDPSTNTNALVFGDNGYYRNFSGAWTDSGVTPVVGDKITLNVDLDANTFEFRVNNSVAASGTIGQAAGTLSCFMHSNFDAANGVMALNFGQRPFAYSPPAGFKALCTKNLPTPSITNPKKHFDVVLATGANIKSTVEALYSDQALMVVKDRANANNWQWFNDVTGLSAILQSNTTSAETTYSAPTGSSVGYGWKAGGAPVANTAGSITSQVSANPQAGFSIVTYTGTGANATVGHGLGVAPKMVIVKNRTGAAANWPVYVQSIGAGNALTLSSTSASTGAAAWNSTAPTSSVFSVGGGSLTNIDSSTTYVAYCFAEIPSYSKIGSYTGNGSADGPFVHCGFRPAFVMIKRTDVVNDWVMWDVQRDTYNAMDTPLKANTSDADQTGWSNTFDALSNGLKFRASYATVNASGGTYIYMAFAENPFKYSLAR